MVCHYLLTVIVVFLNLLGSSKIFGKISPLTRQYAIQSGQFSSYSETKVCRTVAGLTKAQIELCFQQPDTFLVALEGLNQAVSECQHQFQGHRWNCSSLSTKSQNPYNSAILQKAGGTRAGKNACADRKYIYVGTEKGYKETAFAYALASASVAISVARGCSAGALTNCGCDTKQYKMRTTRDISWDPNSKSDISWDPHSKKGSSWNPNSVHKHNDWKWGGCSHNIQYGIKFAKLFLDSRERAEDIHSKINLHNNHVGRMAVKATTQLKCKCHGMSGSCELKTCWRAAPDFRAIGKTLKERFRSAIYLDQANLGDKSLRKFNVVNQKKKRKQDRIKLWTFKKNKQKRDLSYDLVYYQKSPNFCEKDQILDVAGTTGRFCNVTSQNSDSCSSLCCGRGYNQIKRTRLERCKCKFLWCCTVECQTCVREEWISVCK